MRKSSIAAVLLLMAAAGVAGWWFQLREPPAADPPDRPPVTVTTTEARSETWQPRLTAVASLRAIDAVSVTTDISGIVETIAFTSGQAVERGEVLLRLDDSTEQARLRDLLAGLELARQQLERTRALVEGGLARSEADLDEAQARYRSAQAAVAEQRAIIADKTITAPFAGRVGLARIDRGAFVGAGEPVVDLVAADPVLIDFTLPDETLPRLDVGLPLEVSVGAFPDRVFDGRIRSIDPRADSATRQVVLEGEAANPDALLKPGLSANVAVRLPEREDVVTLPVTAISYNPYGDFVFGVEEADGGLVARRVFVEAGPRRGTQVAVLDGVAPGDRVVTSGQLKLEDGAAITVDNDTTPADRARDPAKVKP